jgi:ABC-type sugar transport system ATPase subunit
MAKIVFDRVQKRFGDTVIVPEFDLAIEDGEFFTFVGPSGCGKSTLLNMVAGLEEVTAGELRFDELRVNELSPRERDVAMVFQSYALYPHLSVYENIAFPLRMKKMPRAEVDEEVRRVAGLLGLSERLRDRPKELSGGQRQRVALGRAIVRRPKVFLLDEPLSNLDARLRIEMRKELKRLHRELGITTIYVTHEQAEALSLSDRIAVLQKGRIQQCGTPAEVYLRPANLFVAGFMGSLPMNFFPADAFSSAGLGGAAAADVLVGIRPEDWAVTRSGAPEAAEVGVTFVEPAGSFAWVAFEWSGAEGKGRAELSEDLRPGEVAYAAFPWDRAHLFDRASGKRLAGHDA